MSLIVRYFYIKNCRRISFGLREICFNFFSIIRQYFFFIRAYSVLRHFREKFVKRLNSSKYNLLNNTKQTVCHWFFIFYSRYVGAIVYTYYSNEFHMAIWVPKIFWNRNTEYFPGNNIIIYIYKRA